MKNMRFVSLWLLLAAVGLVFMANGVPPEEMVAEQLRYYRIAEVYFWMSTAFALFASVLSPFFNEED